MRKGVPDHPSLAQPDAGAGRFRFRTPSLRNVALTAPYMHNGMLATVQDVLRFYDNGRSENPNVSNERDRDRRRNENAIVRVSGQFPRVDNMTTGEMDIIAFLHALDRHELRPADPGARPERTDAGRTDPLTPITLTSAVLSLRHASAPHS
jgi:cytochrome c peroxidase